MFFKYINDRTEAYSKGNKYKDQHYKDQLFSSSNFPISLLFVLVSVHFQRCLVYLTFPLVQPLAESLDC